MRLNLLLVVPLLGACTSAPGGDEPFTPDKTVGTDLDCRLLLGEAYSGHVDAYPDGTPSSAEDLRGRVLVSSFQVEAGQTFAFVARSADPAYYPDFDPYVTLYAPDRSTTFEGRQQHAAPMAAREDVVIFHTAPESGLYVALSHHAAYFEAGDLSIHVVPIPGQPVIDAGDPDLDLRRAWAELNRVEPDVVRFMDAGYVEELADGHLAILSPPLSERGGVRAVVDLVNEQRDILYYLLARDTAPDVVGEVVEALRALWTALRAPTPEYGCPR